MNLSISSALSFILFDSIDKKMNEPTKNMMPKIPTITSTMNKMIERETNIESNPRAKKDLAILNLYGIILSV